MTIENFISPLDFSDKQASSDEIPFHVHFLANLKAKCVSLKPMISPLIEAGPIIEKVKEVAQTILKATISVFLYWVNPSLFAIGFIAGIIIDDQVRCAIQKIKSVWKNQELTGCLLGTFACALSMPVALAAASLLWSAHFGSLMHPSADETIQMPPGV
jgi:hypothetical protein